MRRRVGSSLAVCAALAVLAGCGDEARFSEKKVFAAAKVEDGQVEGDPFCVVDAVLSSADAIEEERSLESAQAIITSKSGNVGVVVVPPFPGDCEETVQAGLNKLDPSEQQAKD